MAEKVIDIEKLSIEEVAEVLWLVEHQEYEHKPAGSVGDFIEGYLGAGGECWPQIRADLEGFEASRLWEAVFEDAVGGGKVIRQA